MNQSTTPPWSHWAADDFRIQQCSTCGTFQHPPGRLCADCHNSDMAWVAAERRGTVLSWSVVHRAPIAAFADLTPYTIALIELVDGPLMEMWFRDSDGTPDIGQPVRISVGDVAGRKLPVAVPAQS